jgi:hypothetical protein
VQRAEKPVNAVLGKLTAIRNATNNEFYEQELTAKLEDPEVKNIAITGPYGSGKTSVIQTFFTNNPQYKPLYVSLAAFKDEQDTGVLTPEVQKALDDRIEYSILQQLFYYVKGKDVPFSRLKRIRTVSRRSIFTLTFLIIVLVLAALYTYKPNWLPGYLLWCDYTDGRRWIDYLAAAVVVIGAGALVYTLFRFQQHASLIKLNLDKAELEISPDKGASVLNQHMDEIVYYFTATPHDLLVIEDLDRFKNAEIFVKLREINTLINNSLQIRRKVTFIYALRDDVFSDENRTKFFDFILPLVPVINAANAASTLIQKFDTLKLETPVSRSLLQDVSLYVTDSRLIQTIVNEFEVYRRKLNNGSLKNDMLLALILYKNLFPGDFVELQSNRGMVYKAFEEWRGLVKGILDKKQEEIKGLEREFEVRQEKHFKSLKELQVYFLALLYIKLYKEVADNFMGRIYVEGEFYALDEIAGSDLFDKLVAADHIKYEKRYSYSPGDSNIKFSEIGGENGPQGLYVARIANEKGRYNIQGRLLEEDIRKIRLDMSRINRASLEHILIENGWQSFTSPVKDSPILSYLLSNGFITDEYRYYIASFRSGDMSEDDLYYVLSVKNRKGVKWEHSLNNIELVVQRINANDCLGPAILNFDLVTYMLQWEDREDLKGKIEGIANVIVKFDETGIRFMDEFRQMRPDYIEKLVVWLVRRGPNFTSFILNRSHFNKGVQFEYILMMINRCSLNRLQKQNEDRILSDYIGCTLEFFLEENSDRIRKLIEVVKVLKVNFTVPPPKRSGNMKLMEYVYKHHSYELNPAMIDYMLDRFENVADLKEFNRAQLTNILKMAHSPLCLYVQSDREDYLVKSFIPLENHDQEDTNTMVVVLSDNTVSDGTKMRVIERVSFKVSDLRLLPVQYYHLLLANARCIPGWRNIIRYYQTTSNYSVDEQLMVYIESVHKELFNTPLPAGLDQEDEKDLDNIISSLLMGKVLKNESKLELIGSGVVERELFINDFSGMSVSLVHHLLRHLALERVTLSALIKDSFMGFVELTNIYWDELLPLLEQLPLEERHYYTLLQASWITPDRKQAILDRVSREVMLGLIKRGYHIPVGAIQESGFEYTDEDILAILKGDRKPAADTLVGLILGYADQFSEETLVELLLALGGPFAKIAKKQGKEVDNAPWMTEVLKVLSEVGELVERFTTKTKIIEVKYIE